VVDIDYAINILKKYVIETFKSHGFKKINQLFKFSLASSNFPLNN